jgi:hypothetical protein
MNCWMRALAPIALCAALSHSLPALADDDDDKPPAASSGEPSLDREQQNAAGIVVTHPIRAKSAQRIDALGIVLDPTQLISEAGDAAAAGAAEQSAVAEVTRLRELQRGGAGASLKMLEAAQAEQAKITADSQSAAARFSMHWGPIAGMPADARLKLQQAASNGHSLLLRVEVPGRHSIGALPGKALLDVDGIQVPGRVLGPLRQTSELQSVGLLVEVLNPPAGLGPGARIPVALLAAEQTGLSLPRNAILYNETGAYVFKQIPKKAGEPKTRYSALKVTLVSHYGDGWLVTGVDDDDAIVVHGAGVLWSLQGVDAHAVDDDD